MNTIKVIFTEEDRQNADKYDSNTDCLLATALKRMGFEDVSVGGWGNFSIDGIYYRPVTKFNVGLVEDEFATQAPYYYPSVVGMEMEFTNEI